ncbi:NADH-ubiquinone oxidoreductase-F iron-sulfur binding region domain-containing protein [Chloroflexota bacterium]
MPYRTTKREPIDPDIIKTIEEHDSNPEALLDIFQELNIKHGGLTNEIIFDVSSLLNIPAQHAYGVASFYSMLSLTQLEGDVMRICDGPVCWLSGADEIRNSAALIFEDNPKWHIERTSCLGLCDRAPAVLVNNTQVGPITTDKIASLTTGYTGHLLDYSESRPGETRVMMARAGMIDPSSLGSALKHGAYEALKTSFSRAASSLIGEMEDSGLTGRGGAGFPVGRKWRFVAQENRAPKYIFCNADESEPLIFKDRVLIDTNPHQILEGMAIAGYACGANEGYIYIRGEYESQALLLESAIEEAENDGFLGNNVLGSNFSFSIHVHRGAGAYICGEETALIESLEGYRGEPRLRPPYPPEYGYHGKPTLVNNVESFAAVPAIISNGADWYKSLSTYKTPGTKIYIVLGHVNSPGLFEAPFGLTLRQIINDFGCGMKPGSSFNFALAGGAAGTITPPSLLDVPIDYASTSEGVSLGAGAFLICDQTVSPVDFLREVLYFFKVESCGKCTPCRVGTHRSYEILARMANGGGTPGDVDQLYALAEVMEDSSFCGLGQSVAVPIKSALTHYKEAFAECETA